MFQASFKASSFQLPASGYSLLIDWNWKLIAW
jgi:hypothetical protein